MSMYERSLEMKRSLHGRESVEVLECLDDYAMCLFRAGRFEEADTQLRHAVAMTDELLGSGFAIVGQTDADLVLSEAAERIVERIGARRVSLQGLSEVRGHFDRGFEHSRALIVRPDRYVYGCTDDTHNLDGLIGTLAQALHLI